MTTGKSRFCSLLGIITLNQAQLTATFPLMTLIFFDTQSRLFAADVSTATRSLWYGLAVGLPSIINLFLPQPSQRFLMNLAERKFYSLRLQMLLYLPF